MHFRQRIQEYRVNARLKVERFYPWLMGAAAIFSAIDLYVYLAIPLGPELERAVRIGTYVVLGLFLFRGVLEGLLQTRLRRAFEEHPIYYLSATLGLGLVIAHAGAWYTGFPAWLTAARVGRLLLEVYLVATRAFLFLRILLVRWDISAPTLLLISFAAFIGLGTLFLLSPKATPADNPIGVLDAAFTATSATCVTGLIVRDTPTEFTRFGQTVILILIQIGGLGIMTFAGLFFTTLGGGLSLRDHAAIRTAIAYEGLNLTRILIFIIAATLVFEIGGAAWLYWTLSAGAESPLFDALFHSISAYCNAGFALRVDSLESNGGLGVLLPVSLLILLGGIGYVPLRDLFKQIVHLVRRIGGKRRGRRPQFSAHTKLVLLITGVLLLTGAVGFFVFELLAGDPTTSVWNRTAMAVFQSITARTAGFNSVPIGGMVHSSIFLMIALMFIGASPGSTGGGVKTSTIGVLWLHITSRIRNRPEIEAFQRTLPSAVTSTAAAIVTISTIFVTGGVILVAAGNPELPFRDILFEVVSAHATVGLSTGITDQLSSFSRGVLIVLMYVGRLGPMTIVLATTGRKHAQDYQYPTGRFQVG